jgi:hypothetical protein
VKLTNEQVENISTRVLKALKAKKLLVFKAGEAQILAKMQEAFLGDLHAEEELDREVEEIIKNHTGEMESRQVDYRRMFGLIKSKLAREREIVL